MDDSIVSLGFITGFGFEGGMARFDLYLKVEIDVDEREKPDRVAAEICRLIGRVYGVRHAEVSNIVEREK